jgi:hypothetical protein
VDVIAKGSTETRQSIDVVAVDEDEATYEATILMLGPSDGEIYEEVEVTRVARLEAFLDKDGYITDAAIDHIYPDLQRRFGDDSLDKDTMRQILNAGSDYAAGRRTDSEAKLSYLAGVAAGVLDRRTASSEQEKING